MPENDTPKFCPQCGHQIAEHQRKFCSRLCANTSRMANPDLPNPNPSGLCMCGCGQPTKIATRTFSKSGHVRGCPVKFIRNHSQRALTNDLHAGVFYVVNDETQCWEWQRAKDRKGYGIASWNGQKGFAHRHYYEQAKGAIPDGYQVDHLCRNPSCVNPNHLEAVLPVENTRRGRSAKLTKEDVAAIRLLASCKTYEELGREYGVTSSAINQVVNFRSWKDVDSAA